MRRAVLLLAAAAAIGALPTSSASADLRPLPDLDDIVQGCDPAACPNPVEGVQECVTNGVAALVDALEGTPQPQTCDPTGRSALRPPPPHCDPMACPDPVGEARECLETLALGQDPETGQPYLAGDCDLRR